MDLFKMELSIISHMKKTRYKKYEKGGTPMKLPDGKCLGYLIWFSFYFKLKFYFQILFLSISIFLSKCE